MSTVTVNIVASEVQYPSGTTTSGTKISLVAPAGAAVIPSQTVAVGVLTAVFDSVPDGVGYTATAELLDGSGNVLGLPVTSATFDVVTPTVGIATPNSITVTVSA